MSTRSVILALAAVVAIAPAALAQQEPGFWTKPAIKEYGPVHVWPNVVVRPTANATYKALFDVTKPGKPGAVNPGLNHIARAVNAFAAAGVPLRHLKFAVIIHGPATPIVLSDKAYQEKFGHPNPNLAIIADLKKAGVNVMVCGNALGDMSYTPAEVNPHIKVALSALSTLIILQNEGYALIRM